MKKKILTVAALACAAACTIGGIACSGSGATQKPSKEPTREKIVTIADFETWQSGIQLIRTGKYFGTINENTDLKYVKSGKKSALLHPLGGYRSANSPIFFFPTVSETYDFDHSDFSDADKVTFEFYNAEDKDVNVAVGLVTSVTGLDVFQKTSLEYQPLQTGWNTVTYTVDVSTISINADVKDIQGIYVAFESVRSREEADAPDIYLDDVILYRKDKPAEIQNLVNLDEYEYSDFEKSWQKYTVGVRNTANAPTISIVNAADYKVGAAPAEGETDERPTLKSMENSKVSGDKVLRAFAPNGSQYANSYPGIEFAPALLQRSLFGQLKEEDYGRVTFAFDIYNNSPVRMYWGVSFYNYTSSQRMEYGIYVEPYAWTPFSVLIKDLYDDFREKNKNSTSLFTDPGELAIYWAEFVTGDAEFFFDNFRYEVDERDMEAKPTIHMSPFVRVAAVGDQLELPFVTATDKYDLELEAKLSVYQKNGEEWVDLPLNDDGLIPIEQLGDYKIVAKAINSLGNEAVEEYFFRGVESVEDKVWISYDYADEAANVHIKGEWAEDNQSEWKESVTLGGETKNGVVKASTQNANTWGAGYFGLRFPKQRLDDAAEENWDYFTISVYIQADAASVTFYSFNKILAENVPTGCWTEVKITKALLNGESRINKSKTPLNDILFYENFYKMCGQVGGENYTEVLFIKGVEKAANSSVTYYIDKITWGKYAETWYGDDDATATDVYDKEWVDPWLKKDEEQ